MSISDPDRIVSDYLQLMMSWLLFVSAPRQVLQLGLGGGALSKYCYRKFPDIKITAVEIDPAVVGVCRNCFCLPSDDSRLSVIIGDAHQFVRLPDNFGQYDVIFCDLYEHDPMGPAHQSLDFYRACKASCVPSGVVVFNIWATNPSILAENLRHIQAAFPGLTHHFAPVHGGNVVVLALCDMSSIDLVSLYERAHSLEQRHPFSATNWVRALAGAAAVWPDLKVPHIAGRQISHE